MGHVVRLTVVPDEAEAELLCRMLALEGIPCRYRKVPAAVNEGGYSFAGDREVLVDEADLRRARELLPAPDAQ